MATRRSQRRDGEKLSDRIGDVEAEAKKQVMADKRAALEAKYADVQCRFDILSLIPELRARIYAYAMGGKPHSLMDLKLPTLALVSKQVRAEVLPVFFAGCVFTAHIGSNYPTIPALDALAERDELPDGFNQYYQYFGRSNRDLLGLSYQRSGSLRVYERTVDLLKKLTKRENITVSFRNVNLRIHSMLQLRPPLTETWTMAIYVPTASKLKPVINNTSIYISTDEDAYESETQPEQDTLEARESARPVELALIRNRARVCTESLASSKEKFLGFTLDDLKSIAMVFRYWPVEQPVRERSKPSRGRRRLRR